MIESSKEKISEATQKAAVVTEKVGEKVDVATEKASGWLRTKYAVWMLGFVSFIESIFAPILIDPVLASLVIAKPKRWIFYTIVATVSSLAGGVVAYVLGSIFLETIGRDVIALYKFEAQFAAISTQLNTQAFFFTFIGALTPIPYKLVALAAGATQINIVVFIIATIVGRSMRLGIVAWLSMRFGAQALQIVRTQLNYILLALLVAAAAYLAYYFLL